VPVAFQTIFKSENRPRDKFLSRLFGIFSEEIVRCWASDERSPYRNLGRPTIKSLDGTRRCTLDFTFESNTDGKVYVAELKCELEYQDYKYLTLESPEQLVHHSKEAFRIFLELAEDPNLFTVTVGGKPLSVSGSILIWGSLAESGRASVIEKHGLQGILSLEAIIIDLVTWQNKDFAELLDKYQTWTTGLFSGLREIVKAGRP
jgi:hypothetical protein